MRDRTWYEQSIYMFLINSACTNMVKTFMIYLPFDQIRWKKIAQYWQQNFFNRSQNGPPPQIFLVVWLRVACRNIKIFPLFLGWAKARPATKCPLVISPQYSGQTYYGHPRRKRVTKRRAHPRALPWRWPPEHSTSCRKHRFSTGTWGQKVAKWICLRRPK